VIPRKYGPPDSATRDDGAPLRDHGRMAGSWTQDDTLHKRNRPPL